MTTVHSKLGASKAERWLQCPGSVALCDTVPPAPGSKYADEGSAAHWIGEQCLLECVDAADMIGVTCPDYPDFPCTAEMASAVQVYVDYCRSLIGGDHTGRHVLYEVEHRFQLTDIDDLLFGTADFFAFHYVDSWLYDVDYKHGAGVPVGVYQNAQVMYYALGAVQAMREQGHTIEGVTLTIVQPRAPGKDIKTWSPPLKTLAAYAETLRNGVEATREPDAPLRAGPWCRWCDAKPVCPKYVASDGAGDFADVKFATAEFQDVAGLADIEDLLNTNG